MRQMVPGRRDGSARRCGFSRRRGPVRSIAVETSASGALPVVVDLLALGKPRTITADFFGWGNINVFNREICFLINQWRSVSLGIS